MSKSLMSDFNMIKIKGTPNRVNINYSINPAVNNEYNIKVALSCVSKKHKKNDSWYFIYRSSEKYELNDKWKSMTIDQHRDEIINFIKACLNTLYRNKVIIKMPSSESIEETVNVIISNNVKATSLKNKLILRA